jgi:predicted TIM-barrel fold metal-dependent hydrolase
MTPAGAPGVCDADNHYYEPLDACTRHLPAKFKTRGVQFIETKGRVTCLIGEKVSHFIPNPTFSPVAKPGCADEYYRGLTPMHKTIQEVMVLEPECRPSFRQRDARLAEMDAQGVDKALFFPTFGYGLEEALAADPEAAMATVTAFNEWLRDDWGYRYRNRIFAAPLLCLADPVRALAELETVLAAGACVVTMRPAPVACSDGRKSLGEARFDPIWARLSEAKVPVAFHIADSGYQRYAADWGDDPEFRPIARGNMTMGKLIYQERPIFDTIAALVTQGVFKRHPRLRIASIENGALWLPLLMKKLTKAYYQKTIDTFGEPPADTLRRSLWVSPYAEDDFPEVFDLLGTDNVLMGSDWPHAEGLERPLEYELLLDGCSEAQKAKVMRENFLAFAPMTVA